MCEVMSKAVIGKGVYPTVCVIRHQYAWGGKCYHMWRAKQNLQYVRKTRSCRDMCYLNTQTDGWWGDTIPFL